MKVLKGRRVMLPEGEGPATITVVDGCITAVQKEYSPSLMHEDCVRRVFYVSRAANNKI